MDHIKKVAPVILSVMLGIFFVLSLHLAWVESTTMDEKAHIPSAYSYVAFGDMRLNPEHPPLLKDLAGLPLLAMDLAFPTDSWQWREGINEQWTLGDLFIFGSGNDAELVTFWSRFPIILVSVLLGFFIYLWTKELAGTVAALFAVLLFVADPNIIGHGHFVTTDIGIAAFIFIAFFFFVRFLRDPSWKNLALSGVALGLAELAKFSAVLLFPYFALIGLGYAVTRPIPEGARSRLRTVFANVSEFVWKYAVMVVICFVVIYALYLPNTVTMPAEKLGEIAAAVFPGDKPAGRFAIDTVTAMSVVPGLKPLAEYFLGVFMVFMRVAGGNTYYFLGTVSNHATPWYFPVVFALKETLPFLFLLSAASIYTLSRIIRAFVGRHTSVWGTVAHSFQSHIAQYTMFGFVVLYAYVSITGNLNIGFRHLFPILPFLYVLVAKTVFDYLRRQDFAGERSARAILFALVLWIAAIPVLAYPSYLSYFNAAAGGSENGYRFVTDSNYDWGQDVKRLRDWIEAYNEDCASLTDGICATTSVGFPIAEIKVDYFGGTNPRYYLGDRYVEWHSDWGRDPGWYAISIGFYMESIHRTDIPADKTYRWLAGYAPVARIGDSILVYYIRPVPDDWAREHGTCSE